MVMEIKHILALQGNNLTIRNEKFLRNLRQKTVDCHYSLRRFIASKQFHDRHFPDSFDMCQ